VLTRAAREVGRPGHYAPRGRSARASRRSSPAQLQRPRSELVRRCGTSGTLARAARKSHDRRLRQHLSRQQPRQPPVRRGRTVFALRRRPSSRAPDRLRETNVVPARRVYVTARLPGDAAQGGDPGESHAITLNKEVALALTARPLTVFADWGTAHKPD
jgi:hypothetical protein